MFLEVKAKLLNVNLKGGTKKIKFRCFKMIKVQKEVKRNKKRQKKRNKKRQKERQKKRQNNVNEFLIY